ncbi:hypothetical protein GCM10011509_33820 [Ornithinimicrobium pekingense]|uniref:DUF1648 domain-containing protein n=2 Tax=Ornithinimicrobium pekingense TaxID=384677 RepID=A0ABQ2FDC8_9MICO|nr:hypothetical protein GCM10011509_33820 [Ornithinimicrobium pekingense]
MNSRRALAGLLAILPLAALLLVVVVLPPPPRVPTHWAGARPDGWTAGPAFVSGVLTVTVLCAVAAAAMAVLQRAVPQAWSRWVVATTAAVGWGAVVLYAVTVWRTGVDGPERVGAGWALLAVAAALGAGAAAYAVHARRVPAPEELREQIPERARVQPVRGRAVRPVDAWATEISSTTLRVIGWGLLVVFAVVSVLTLVTGESLALVALVVLVVGGAAGLALAWSAVRVRVDAEGLSVRSQVLPLQLARVPSEGVAGVEVLDLDPMQWGGIGLRALPERTAYIVDGGPGIVVWKRDGRRLALQVTEGDAAARAGARALLQAAGQRLGESSGSSSS